MVKKRSFKKMMAAGLITLACSSALSTIAGAATIEITKVQNDVGTLHVNDGVTNPFGADVIKLNGAKFTTVDLTADYTAYYKENKTSGETPQDVYEAYVASLRGKTNEEIAEHAGIKPENFEAYVNTNQTAATGETVGLGDGRVDITKLPEKSTVDGKEKDAVYAILETTLANHLINADETESIVIGSAPVFIAFPFTSDYYTAEDAVAGRAIKIYPKNEYGEAVKTPTKGSEDFEIGDEVGYTIDIDIPSDFALEKYKNFTVTDVPGTGLTFTGFTGITVEGSEMTWAEFLEDYDPTITPDPVTGDGETAATLSVDFKSTDADLREALAGKKLTFSVTGKINDNVIISQTTDMVVKNTATYSITNSSGKTITSEPSTPDIETFKYIFQKNDAVDGKALTGAVFQVTQKVEDEDVPLTFKKVILDGKDVYRVSKDEGEDEDSEKLVTDLVVNEDGTLPLYGLDNEEYTLVETKAPDNYRLEKTSYDFTPTDKKSDANGWAGDFDQTGELEINKDDGYYNIYNTPETVLPSTGGNGFMIFTFVAAAGMASAGGFYILKKKSSQA
ncbi:SpaH/EbpB family LPXTG-anchored major pilin [Pseudolactococcus insecticola]|uniref:Peptidase n=1 Tax=Pseudolactococcus insecticola TaxID=2709158 RepID=A0A6A0B4T1_9LACT|nr:SpaH/EbpB family LPXTG-anchored major pilin [Lactococcus insecticola]GFH40389.1 peptidase [Lactococcus insecticola]